MAKKIAKKSLKKPAKKSPAKLTKKPVKKLAKKIAKPAKKIVPKSKKIVKTAPTKKVIPTPKSSVKKMSAVKKLSKLNKNIVIPSGYKPSEKEEYMNDLQLAYFKQKLTAWKAELSKELAETMENLKEENWQESDLTDRATVETDAGLELRTRDRYRKLVNKIDAALIRIDKGDYGYCDETGEEIGIKRLMARPIATLSIEAQERHERDEKTHFDEDLEERLQ